MNVNKNSSLLGKYSTKEDIVFKNKNDDGVLLLLDKPRETTEILKTIGFDEHLLKIEKEVHLINSKKVMTELFGKPAFLGSEIKKVCNDYDLVISKVSNYKGAPFENLPEIIQEFMDFNSTDVEIPAKTERNKVYLYEEDGITPKCYFGTDEQKYDWRTEVIVEAKIEKKSKIKTGYSNWFIMVPREAFSNNKIKNNCCTLFYRDNDDSANISEKDVFIEVYSWGKNYSESRKYNYFTHRIDFQKEFTNRGNTYESDDNTNIGIMFYVLLFFIMLGCPLYFYNFYLPFIVQSVLFLIMFLSIRKHPENYKTLWKL